MRPCQRPLDSIDAEAVAAGADPVFAADAVVHARQCLSCGAVVAAAASLTEALEGLCEASSAVSGLAGRVTRLRAFSRQERRTYALWNTPVLLTAGLASLGFALLDLPILAAGEQVSVGAAAAAPILALIRSASRWAIDLIALAPDGLQALSEGLRQNRTIGLTALVMLMPLAMGLSRVLARAPGRK